MAISTQGTIFSWTPPGGSAKSVEIKDFPDLGGAPTLVDTTTLSSTAPTSRLGKLDPGVMEFTCNYTKATFDLLYSDAQDNPNNVNLGEDNTYSITFQDGTSFTWTGTHTVWLAGGGVDAPKEMKIGIAPSSMITKVGD